MSTLASKEVYLFLDKHVKSEKKGMFFCIYIVLVNGKLSKNATIDPVFWGVLQPINHHIYSCTAVDMSTSAKKDFAGPGI